MWRSTDFMLGRPSAFRQGSPAPDNVRGLHLSWYAQDDIKVNRRLTLNLGLRYELPLPPIALNDAAMTYRAGAAVEGVCERASGTSVLWRSGCAAIRAHGSEIAVRAARGTLLRVDGQSEDGASSRIWCLLQSFVVEHRGAVRHLPAVHANYRHQCATQHRESVGDLSRWQPASVHARDRMRFSISRSPDCPTDRTSKS